MDTLANIEPTLRVQTAVWFPGVRLERVEDEDFPISALSLSPTQHDLIPLVVSTAPSLDPLIGLLGAFAGSDSSCGLRITCGKASSKWTRWAIHALSALKRGHKVPPRGMGLWLHCLLEVVRETQIISYSSSSIQNTPLLKAAEDKVQSSVFATSLWIWSAAPQPDLQSWHVRNLCALLTSYIKEGGGNSFQVNGPIKSFSSLRALDDIKAVAVHLSAMEIASLYHLPTETSAFFDREPLRSAASKVPQLPDVLAEEAIVLGEAVTMDGNVPFTLSRGERRLHTYLIGKTGTGKSSLLANIARQDLEAGRGLGLLDPHGELAEWVLSLVPPSRFADVLYFNPADTEFPVGFNPLRVTRSADRTLVASQMMSVLKKLFGEFWGPRLAHFTLHSLLALLETPSPSLLDLPRLLTDPEHRRRILR